jgi:peptide/nickel transport system ATP-binding protein
MLYSIQGIVPSLKQLPRRGCRFAPRIPWIGESMHEEQPVMHEVSPGHFVRCSCYRHFYFPHEEAGLS